MKQKFIDLSKSILEEIDSSNLDEFQKAQLRDLIENARCATNGLKPEEKIQLMSENQFTLSSLICLMMLRDAPPKTTSWQHVAYEARWAISFVLVVALLIFATHPTSLSMILSFFKGG